MAVAPTPAWLLEIREYALKHGMRGGKDSTATEDDSETTSEQ